MFYLLNRILLDDVKRQRYSVHLQLKILYCLKKRLVLLCESYTKRINRKTSQTNYIYQSIPIIDRF